MTTNRPMRRKWFCFALFSILANLAGNCPPVFFPPPFDDDFVEVELINETDFLVDPGLFVDGVFFEIDPPLEPGEIVVLEFDCFVGTTFETDAILIQDIFDPFFDIPSDNIPIAEEGFEFLCGDTVSFIFIDDGFDFFTRLEVNGLFVSD